MEELNLSFPIFSRKYEFVLDNVHQVLLLPKLQQINLSGDPMDRINGFYYLQKIYERLGGGDRIDIDLVWDFCL
jgi:hypothetical protein